MHNKSEALKQNYKLNFGETVFSPKSAFRLINTVLSFAKAEVFHTLCFFKNLIQPHQ